MLKQLTTPDDMGITLQQAKDFLRVEYSEDDALIESMVKGATRVAQSFINQQISECQYVMALDEFEKEIKLLSPVKTIDSVKYYDADNVLQTVNPSNYYLVDIGLPNKLCFTTGFSIPALYDRPDAVQITFTSGMNNIADDIKAFIRIRVATLYQSREEYISNSSQNLAKIDDKYLNSFLYNHKVF